MVDILKIIGNHMNNNNIFTFGDKDDDRFIEKLPTERSFGVVLTEQDANQSINSFGATNMAYRQRNANIFVISEDIKEGRDLSMKIYDELNKSTVIGTNIFSLQVKNPVFVADTAGDGFIFVVEIQCKER